MPSRWLSVLIVVFWLATTGWLFWHDLWPNWQPGQPPPYHIDFVEEVQKGDTLKTRWTVQRKREKETEFRDVFRAETWVDYRSEDDTFTLHADFKALPPIQKGKPVLVRSVGVTRMTSAYRVNRAGQLRGMKAEVETSLGIGLTVWGEVRGEQFFAHYRLPVLLTAQPLEGDLPPVAVSHHGSVLMPLHPVNRIKGLRPGQTWRMPLVDPLQESFHLGSGGLRYLNARVLPEPLELTWKNSKPVKCLVIEYEGEDIHARTWVARDSERVQRQEATIDGVDWVIQRDAAYFPH